MTTTFYFQFYTKLTRPFRQRKRLLNACVFTEKLLVGISSSAYLFLVFYALFQLGFAWERVISLLLCPASCLFAVSLMRKLVKRKRPYERGVQPLVPKNAMGNSFPSRHASCAFVIAVTSLPYFPFLSAVLFASGTGIVFFRFLFGHHYFTDLLAGVILGVAFGVLGLIFVI